MHRLHETQLFRSNSYYFIILKFLLLQRSVFDGTGDMFFFLCVCVCEIGWEDKRNISISLHSLSAMTEMTESSAAATLPTSRVYMTTPKLHQSTS